MRPKHFLLIILAAAVTAVVAGALNMHASARELVPVVFKGAYAVYEGQVSCPPLQTTSTLIITVEDCNATHAKVHMMMLLGRLPVADDASWVSIKHFWSELGLEKKGTVKVSGRKCIVYTSSKNETTMKLYIDEKSGWPLQITLNATADSLPLNICLKLNQTNIKQLKP